MASKRRHTRRRAVSRTPERPAVLTAERIGARGDAVLSGPDGPIYAPGLLPGETARLAVRGARARVLERLTSSQERVAPACSVADACGGCSLQHWRKDAYQAWKRSRVDDALKRAGLTTPIAAYIEAWGEGRRRANFHARRIGAERVVFGYAERAGAQIIDIDHCPVAAPAISRAMPRLRALAAALLDEARGVIDIAVTSTGGGLDVAIRGAGAPGLAGREAGAQAVRAGGWARLTIEGEPIAEAAEALIGFGKAKVSLPPGGFLQATEAGEAALAEIVMGACPAKPARVIDLFAGSGAFALRLAERGPVLAVDGDEASSAALRHAAERTPGLKPVESLWRDLVREPLTPRELTGADLVVIDPPRAGAREQCAQLAVSDVARIVSISCNPATFARDGRTLVEGGYRMGPVTVVDQFAWTSHVECAAVFEQS